MVGGSAGHEGTAVQLGGSLASVFGKVFKLTPSDIRILLTAGMAARFGVAFCLAAHVFAEFSHLASSDYKAIPPYAPMRPVMASAILIGLLYVLGTRQYLGLGVWSPTPGDAAIFGFSRADHVDYWS